MGRQLRLALPQLAAGGLSENWFLKDAGDLHWELLGALHGLPVTGLTDEDGERLLPAFVRVRLSAPDSLSCFAEGDEAELSGRIARLDAHSFAGDVRLTAGDRHVRARLLSVFVRRSAGNVLAPGVPVQQPVAAAGEPSAEQRELHREFREAAPGGAGRGAALHTRVHRLNPYVDVNGAGLLYFASYPHVADRCEREHLHGLLGSGEADWAVEAATVERDVVYLGNCGIGDAVRVRLESCRFEAGLRVRTRCTLLREGDGEVIARVEAVKQVRAGSAFAVLWGQRVAAPVRRVVREPVARELTGRVLPLLAEVLGVPEAEVAAGEDLRELGLDSFALTTFAAEAGARLGVPVDPSALFQARTAAEIARVLGGGEPVRAVVRSRPRSSGRIAVVGMAGRFPGAETPARLWELLEGGGEAVRDVPADRWDPAEHPGAPARAGLLSDVRRFDHAFFRVSPREAELMDPQQRLFLETAWETFEDAGQDVHALAGSSTGVYVGVCHSDYAALLAGRVGEEPHAAVATSPSIIPNRVSHSFGLRGPSVAVDTLCSSSLVALADAVAALRAGACEQALVGGVNVLCDPARHVAYARTGALSPRGRCLAFDEDADGYVRGEGVCAVLLKPLERALADGDHVHAVVRAAVTNHGGRSRSLTAPNAQAQADLLVAAYEQAEVDPVTVGYLEAHGTGTRLGDPIEMRGAREAFERLHAGWGRSGPVEPHCAVGSVKPVIGHLEAAAGLAGVVKVVLAMRHGVLPGTRSVRRLNPLIRLAGSPLRVGVERAGWPRPRAADGTELPRRAGVSSFGMGGSNAHVVLEEPPAVEDGPEAAEGGRVLVPLSARTPEELGEVARELLGVLERADRPGLGPVAHTLRCGRAPLPVRAVFEVSAVEELVRALREFDPGSPPEPPPGPGAEWMSGSDVDWEPVPGGRVVPLPTYPFRRTQHWVGEPEPVAPPPAASAPALLGWEWVPAPAAADQPLTGACLVLVPGGRELPADLLGPGLRAVPVVVEDGAAPALPTVESPVTALVDLLDWPAAAPGGTAAARIALLTEVLAAHRRTVRACLHVSGSSRGEVAGCYRALSAEFTAVRARTIQVEGAAGDLAGVVRAELATADRQTEVRYRGGVRLGPRALPVSADPAAPSALDQLADGAVVITGGTGGIGLLLAADLVRRGVRRLVLIGRRRLPPRARWAALSAAEDTDPDLRRKLTGLLDLIAAGASVTVRTHDLSDVASLRKLLGGVRSAAGGISGVFHCAGALEAPRSLLARPVPERERIIAAKAGGLRVLWAALGSRPPRLLVLFSSIAAALPRLGAGHADYAAANLVLDDFAEAQADHPGCAVRSLQWPLWRDVGMGREHGSAGAELGVPDLTARDALDLLDAALRVDGHPVLLPCLPDPARLRVAELRLGPEAPVRTPAPPDPVVAAGAVLPEWLRRVVARTVRVEEAELGAEVSFTDLGLDSLLLAELVAALEDELGVPVDPGLPQEHPVLGEFAAALGERLPGRVRPAPGPAAAGTAGEGPVPIAVIGMACRFPGSADPERFWRNLVDGRDLVGEVPADRWDVGELYCPEGSAGRSISKWGGFLTDAADFDPGFFGFDEEAARQLDPLVRKTLEVGVECARDAGYPDEQLRGRAVGVFVGSRVGNYHEYLRPLGREAITGMNQNFIAAHLSHHLDLTGPNMVVDSACSSSLVAVHLAAQSLALGESELALAGGVDLLLDAEPYLVLSAGGALSPTGRCRTFDASADGFVPGEGAGMVLLKRLDAAERDGDRILAVIEASGVNNDGRTMGRTTPNGKAQRALIADVLRRGRIDPRTIGYVEAHGTGTMIGDPIELQALTAVFREHTADRGFCGIGSAKSNTGHLLSAAGIAGLIKAVQCLRYRTLPPTLHCERPNPRFAFDRSPFFPVTGVRPWENDSGPGRAAVSAFGFGGTNAHLVLRAAPEVEGARVPLPAPEYRRRRFWWCPQQPQGAAPRSARLDLRFPGAGEAW
ncbi:Pnap_2097 family protein [Saccharopolyspora sp. MS10]|uniref:Pnap_2097 family protein n=1 Tax=Saccharopolyspora sp. MS10 TaxID=3385973 RepID=UPI00399F371D